MRIERRKIPAPSLDMTPMIDCVFLLLIFFLTASQIAQMASLPVALPTEDGEQVDNAATAGLMVNIASTGEISILDAAVEPEELMERMKVVLASDPGAVPVIRADRGAPAERLNAVMDGLRSGGCRTVRIATARREEAR